MNDSTERWINRLLNGSVTVLIAVLTAPLLVFAWIGEWMEGGAK